MRQALRLAALAGIVFLASAAAAKADTTLDYTLTQEGSTTPLATWTMSSMPTPSCPAPGPCFGSGEYFTEIVDLSLDGGPATPDTLVFFNTAFTDGVDLNDLNFLIPEFLGPQLYTGDEGTPTMSTGLFTLTDDGSNGVAGTLYTLDVTSAVMPEPSTFLLLAIGLFCAAFAARRRRLLA